MATTSRVLAIAEKYRPRPFHAASKAKRLQHQRTKSPQTVLPPLKSVHNLAEYNVPGAQFNPTELRLEAGLSETEWTAIGRAITHVESSSKWWIGDWLMAGAKAYGKTACYDLAQQATGQDKRALYVCTYVASRFAPNRRVAALSFSHHTVVAALLPEVADRLLKEAVELGLTSDQLYEMGREECGKKRSFKLKKYGVYLSDDTLEIISELARCTGGKRMAWFLGNIVLDWLEAKGYGTPQKTKKELYAERQAGGFCGYCGKNIPVAGKKTCEKCLATMRKYDRFSRHDMQEMPRLGE